MRKCTIFDPCSPHSNEVPTLFLRIPSLAVIHFVRIGYLTAASAIGAGGHDTVHKPRSAFIAAQVFGERSGGTNMQALAARLTAIGINGNHLSAIPLSLDVDCAKPFYLATSRDTSQAHNTSVRPVPDEGRRIV